MRSNFVLEDNKKDYYQNIISEIKSTFKTEIDKHSAANWKRAFSNAESLFLFDEDVITAIRKSLSVPVDKYLKLQRATLEIAYSTEKNTFAKVINKIFLSTKDKTSYAIATNYLLRANYLEREIFFYTNNMQSKFISWGQSSILKNLYFDLSNSKSEKFEKMPSLVELLQHPFQKGKTIIYSLHRKNRNYPGMTIIKKPDGTFVKNSDGTIFNIPQLAVSFSNLPGYIPNGNTPEGVYSIIGKYISPTQTIGPTPNVLVRSPFEVKPEIFFHNKSEHKYFAKENYTNLLPKTWQNYFPIFQSYYAGKYGRRLIIMHGSTDDLNYYKNKSYYPLSPTRGCLSSKEIWNEQDGKCIESDQAKLINAFYSTKKLKGFLVVIEIDDKTKPVTIDELKKLLQ
ncbi:MAG: hypothetical protein GY932_08060 [Arcobacter sp.]|nr:hypothetical protein [Arcobacter sp.]